MDKKSQSSLLNSQNKVSKDRKSGLSGVSGTRKNGAKVSLLFEKWLFIVQTGGEFYRDVP